MTDIEQPSTGMELSAGKNAYRWPNELPNAMYDWFEFTIPGDADEQGELLRVKINVSFLTSNWKCIFGQGCPGVLISGAMTDRGCCQIGVHMEHDDDDYKRVRGYVEQLTEEDLDANLLAEVQKNGWRYRDKSEDGESALPGYPWHTRVVDGACVLANRAGGSTGKLGCSLHVLANRLQLHHSDTKPNICWQIPMSVTNEYDEDTDQTTMTVTGSPASVWGSTNPTDLHSPGWWCLETPDAFVIGNADCSCPETSQDECPKHRSVDAGMVFRTNEVELRKLMGDAAYDEMAGNLMSILRNGGRRSAMPGENVNGGRPLIPLMVAKRMDQWVDDESEDSEAALKRSVPYMRDSGQVPDGYKLPKLLKRSDVHPVTEVNEPASTGETIHEDVLPVVPAVEFSSATDEQLNAAAEVANHVA